MILRPFKSFIVIQDLAERVDVEQTGRKETLQSCLSPKRQRRPVNGSEVAESGGDDRDHQETIFAIGMGGRHKVVGGAPIDGTSRTT